jgi:hypothetical protein
MAYRLFTALAFVCLTGLGTSVAPQVADAQVHVHGYFRQNGTYVAPYERTFPDGNPCNNYSSRC